MGEVKATYVRDNEGNPGNPSGTSRNTRGGQYKDDFKSAREKSDFINRHGLSEWEKLPLRRPTPSAEKDALDWTQEERHEFVRKHGGLALSQKLDEARAARKRRGFRG
jgi:hypothetical protein